MRISTNLAEVFGGHEIRTTNLLESGRRRRALWWNVETPSAGGKMSRHMAEFPNARVGEHAWPRFEHGI
jgi:hypothetical protein